MLWFLMGCYVVNLLGVLSPVEAGYERTCTMERMNEGPMAHTLCGGRLTDTISTLCEGQGFSVTPNRRKRQEFSVERPFGLQDILANRREAMDYLGKRGNAMERVGVVCECCYHSCSLPELMEYCDMPVKRSVVFNQADLETTDSRSEGPLW